MSLQYSGNGDRDGARITIFGDGTATSVAIDLSKPPFSIDLTVNPPSLVYEATGVGSPGRTLSLNGNILTITFTVAPPATSFAPSRGGIPNTAISPQFVYG